MKNRTIQWGMIGTGDVTERKSGPAFSKIEGSRLLAVANRTPEKAADYASRHGIDRWYRNPLDVVMDPEVDLIYVATPPDSHEEYAMACIDAGKAVYLEKPMARTYEECERINHAAEKAGLPVYVAYYRRSLPYFLQVKEILESGQLGGLQHIRMDQYFVPREVDMHPETLPWRLQPEISGGGYFHDMGCHALDLIFYLFGDPLEVEGMSRNLGSLYMADDTVDALLRLPGDLALKGSWSFIAEEGQVKDRVEVQGKKGSLHFSIFSFEDIHLDLGGRRETFSITAPEHIQMPFIHSIVGEVNKQGSCPSRGQSAAVTSRAMDQICGTTTIASS